MQVLYTLPDRGRDAYAVDKSLVNAVAHGTIKFVFPVPLGIVKVAFAGTPGQPLPFGMLPVRRVHGDIPDGLTLVMGIASCLSTEDRVCDDGPGGDDVMEREKYAPTEDWERDDDPAALLFYAREDMNITGRVDGLLSTLDEPDAEPAPTFTNLLHLPETTPFNTYAIHAEKDVYADRDNPADAILGLGISSPGGLRPVWPSSAKPSAMGKSASSKCSRLSTCPTSSQRGSRTGRNFNSCATTSSAPPTARCQPW